MTQETNGQTKMPDKKKLSTGAKVGVIGGSIAAVVVVIAAIVTVIVLNQPRLESKWAYTVSTKQIGKEVQRQLEQENDLDKKDKSDIQAIVDASGISVKETIDIKGDKATTKIQVTANPEKAIDEMIGIAKKRDIDTGVIDVIENQKQALKKAMKNKAHMDVSGAFENYLDMFEDFEDTDDFTMSDDMKDAMEQIKSFKGAKVSVDYDAKTGQVAVLIEKTDKVNTDKKTIGSLAYTLKGNRLTIGTDKARQTFSR